MKISIREMVLVSMFAALACIGGLLLRFGGTGVVPFSILPFIVLLSGMLLGGRLGALSMVVYAILGIVGIPVFSTAPFGGLAYFVKPTAGFLLGFIGGAYITGIISERFKVRSFRGFLLAAMAGVAVIYIIGLPYLYVVLNFYVGKAVDVGGVLKLAFEPFIGLDLIKAAIASLLAVPISKQLRR